MLGIGHYLKNFEREIILPDVVIPLLCSVSASTNFYSCQGSVHKIFFFLCPFFYRV